MAEFLLEHGALIPLTLPEVRRLVYRVVVRILAPPDAVLQWSHWRRRHQARPSAATIAVICGCNDSSRMRDCR